RNNGRTGRHLPGNRSRTARSSRHRSVSGVHAIGVVSRGANRNDDRREDTDGDQTTSGGVITNHPELLKVAQRGLTTVVVGVHTVNGKHFAVLDGFGAVTNVDVQQLGHVLTRSRADRDVLVVHVLASTSNRRRAMTTSSNRAELLGE